MAVEHSAVIIRCQVESNPTATISWRKDGMTIPDGGRYSYMSSGLGIADVTTEDAGVYVCRATIEELGLVDETSINLEIYRTYSIEPAYRR